MGICKVIYGGVSMTSPMIGLVSDRLEQLPIMGRSPFVIVGTLFSGLGIVWCKVASVEKHPYFFFVASLVWMFGEGLADTTTETIVPDLVPSSQYDLAGAVRSIMYISGGLTGLTALLFLPNTRYDWLYVAYFLQAGLVGLATVIVTMQINAGRSRSEAEWSERHEAQEERETAQTSPADASQNTGASASSSEVPAGEQNVSTSGSWTIGTYFYQSYIVPIRYPGDFPPAMLSLFFLSCGMAPLFFTLLGVRDMVGLEGNAQQFHFSGISMAFFIGAVVSSFGATLANLAAGPAQQDQQPTVAEPAESAEVSTPRLARAANPVPIPSSAGDSRWLVLVGSGLFYSMAVALFPTVSLPSTLQMRLIVYYMLSVGLGLAFGCAYSIIQVLTWVLLPADADVANAMGFVTVVKVVGLGVSNIAAGLILDFFQTPDHHASIVGWAIMGWCSAAAALASVRIQWNLYKGR